MGTLFVCYSINDDPFHFTLPVNSVAFFFFIFFIFIFIFIFHFSFLEIKSKERKKKDSIVNRSIIIF